MIDVTYNRTYHMLTVKGHAQCGAAGHDLVCAACSMLAYTFACLCENASRAAHAGDLCIQMAEGDVRLACRPARKWARLVQMQMDAICAGFELLSKQEPDHVHYERLG